MLLALLTLLPAMTVALPFQATFSSPPVQLPPLNPANFPGHTLIPLSDGNFFPSPAFGVGSVWKHENVTDLVISALNVGYRHIDNSAYYGNEADVALAIKAVGLKREDVYITSKYDGLQGRDIETEFLDSLRLLNTTYLDQYLIHVPRGLPDPETQWPVLESLVDRGLVRSIGVSNFEPSDLTKLLNIPNLRIPPVVNQIKYHPYFTLRQTPAIELAKANGIVTSAFSALTPLTTAPGGPVDEVVEKIAEKEGLTTGQVILDWVKGQGIATVTTSGKEFRQREQLEVFSEDFPKLSKSELAEITAAGVKGELSPW